MAEGYIARLPQGVVMKSQVQTGQVGMAIAQGITSLGQTMSRMADQNAQVDMRVAEDAKRRERSAVTAIWMGKLADAKLEAQQAMTALRTNSKDGAIGHEDAAAAKADELTNRFMDDLGQASGNDPEVLARFMPAVRGFRDALVGEESAWALGQRAKAQGVGAQKAIDAIAITQQSKPDPLQAIKDLTPIKQMIDAADWDGNTKAKVWDGALRQTFGGTLDGLLNAGNVSGVQALLDDGSLQGVFSADEMEQWRGRAKAAGREQQLEVERAASAARGDAVDALKAIKVRIDNGDDVPQAEIQNAFNGAKNAGVKQADLLEFAYLAEGAEQAKAMRGMTTPQLSVAIADLRAKQSAGRASAEEARRLQRAQKALDNRDEKDGENLSTLWRSGPGGQAQAVAQMAAMPVDQRSRVAAKMGQAKLALFAPLPPNARDTALLGTNRRAAQDRAAPFLPQTDKGAIDDEATRTAFAEALSPALINQLGGGGDVYEAALDYYVGAMSKANKSGFDKPAFLRSIGIVMGARQYPDGAWRGGIGDVRGRKVILPETWTGADFDRRMSRFDFAAHGAVYANGAPANKADVLAHYQPTVDHEDPDGTVYYRLQDAQGRSLLTKSRSVFLFGAPPMGGR
ncbi:hypothetical protein [Novosphingobium huizhouense]|uniref:hypothetical protein n=1 Tax=Novosphingobium huizhouense TaxID=2866625 RepID=UPI001CD8B138|nr:hypothetical protein [Novosphingobium huizhouense]